MIRPTGLSLVLAAALVGARGEAIAAPTIELEVAIAADAPFAATQEWAKRLADMGLARVRLRGKLDGDQPRLEADGRGDSARYRLLAVVDRRDRLITPAGAFGPRDLQRPKTYFAELPVRHEEERVERGAFGLSRTQFQRVFDDFATPVAASTLGQSPAELVPVLTAAVKLPIEFAPHTRSLLAKAPVASAELRGLSTGTALAATLRLAGLGVAPTPAGATVTLRVVPLEDPAAVWPIGWKPEEAPRVAAPAMYRLTVIEIENYALSEALVALTPRLGVPAVVDQWKLGREGIDLRAKKVRFPRSKSYVRRAVEMVLSQASLAGELRADDAGRPFYWITQWGPDSPRAE